MAAASPSPNPTNLILLGVLGIGVYWFMTRAKNGAMMPVIYPTPAQNQQAYGDPVKAAKINLLGGLLNKGLDYFGNRQASPYAFDTGGSYGFQPTGSLGLQAQSDGLAFNPGGNVSASDSIYALWS